MSELDADSIFYGSSSPRLAIEDIQAEAASDPQSYARELVKHCSAELGQHFLHPLPLEGARYQPLEDGSIHYSVTAEGGEPHAGHIPAYDLQVDDWYWRLLHARRD